MPNEEAEAIENYYKHEDDKRVRQDFLHRMEKKLHRKEYRSFY
jgi:hypothetical protein